MSDIVERNFERLFKIANAELARSEAQNSTLRDRIAAAERERDEAVRLMKIAAENVYTADCELEERESTVARLTAVVQAARELDLLEDFSEPLGPGQDPEDWDAYNAKRKALSDALAAIPLDPTTEAS